MICALLSSWVSVLVFPPAIGNWIRFPPSPHHWRYPRHHYGNCGQFSSSNALWAPLLRLLRHQKMQDHLLVVLAVLLLVCAVSGELQIEINKHIRTY